MLFATFDILEGINFTMAGINFWPMKDTVFNWGNSAINESLFCCIQVPKLGLSISKSQNRDTLSFLQVIKIVVSKNKVPLVVFVLGLLNTCFCEWNGINLNLCRSTWLLRRGSLESSQTLTRSSSGRGLTSQGCQQDYLSPTNTLIPPQLCRVHHACGCPRLHPHVLFDRLQPLCRNCWVSGRLHGGMPWGSTILQKLQK